MKYTKLIDAAGNARKRAYAPYSHMTVGAALLSSDGTITTGCNIENSSFSLTICAERTALFKAFSENRRKFTALALITNQPEYVTPCGACRQVIWELAGNIDIILCAPDRKPRIVKMRSLLPRPFLKKSFIR